MLLMVGAVARPVPSTVMPTAMLPVTPDSARVVEEETVVEVIAPSTNCPLLFFTLKLVIPDKGALSEKVKPTEPPLPVLLSTVTAAPFAENNWVREPSALSR